jgi:DNA-binding transcriptional LysR family regulator
MDSTRLASFDLNLLVVLDVLLAERNVTRAAKRLGLSQSAVSNALSRLRAALGDGVLVRAANGMVATPRALALQREVGDALGRISHMLGGEEGFDPRTARRSFAIVATDYVQFVLLGELVNRLRRNAPGVSLQVVPPMREYPWDALESGAVDLVLAGARKKQHVPSGLHRRWLFRDRLVCMIRATHPYAAGTLSLKRYLELDHIEALPVGSVALADEILSALGHRRRVVLTVPHFLIAPFVVMQGDYCFTLAGRIAKPLTTWLPLRARPLPYGEHEVTIGAFWHDRVHHDAAHRWLRRQVVDSAAAVEK